MRCESGTWPATLINANSLIFASMARLLLLPIFALLLSLPAAAQTGIDEQYDALINNCNMYAYYKDDPSVRYIRGQILLVINKETPIPEVGAIFEQQGLDVRKLYPVGSAQLALVSVPPGEEHRWITTMKTYKPVHCGYLNLMATPDMSKYRQEEHEE